MSIVSTYHSLIVCLFNSECQGDLKNTWGCVFFWKGSGQQDHVAALASSSQQSLPVPLEICSGCANTDPARTGASMREKTLSPGGWAAAALQSPPSAETKSRFLKQDQDGKSEDCCRLASSTPVGLKWIHHIALIKTGKAEVLFGVHPPGRHRQCFPSWAAASSHLENTPRSSCAGEYCLQAQLYAKRLRRCLLHLQMA